MALPGVLLGVGSAARPGVGATAILDTARAAEAAGFAGIVLPDHVVMGRRTDRYPWGTFPEPPESPWLEPLTVLAAVAGATTTLRLGTGIVIAPLRPAALLAKTAATLDAISGGRLDLGVGTGWQEEEFDALGADHARRGELLTDTMAACRALWGPSPASFSSPSVSFDDIWCEPKPHRPGGPVVLFSGTLTARNVGRIVGTGDGWIPIMGESTDGIAAGVATLRAALGRADRPPDDLRVRASLPLGRDGDGRPDLSVALAGLPALEAAGATDAVVHLGAYVRDEALLETFFERAAKCLADLQPQ